MSASRSPAASGGLGGPQRLGERERALAIRALQVDVAARQRQTVALADGRADLDARRQVEVAHELADHEGLLGVLLAEEGHVGPDHVQQLGDDGRDASKCPTPRATPSSGSVSAADVDGRGEAGRVDVVERRGEEQVGARVGGELRRRAPRRADRPRGRRRR